MNLIPLENTNTFLNLESVKTFIIKGTDQHAELRAELNRNTVIV